MRRLRAMQLGRAVTRSRAVAAARCGAVGGLALVAIPAAVSVPQASALGTSSTAATTTTATTTTTTATTTTATTKSVAPTHVAASMRLVVANEHGHVPFAQTHEPIEVQGTVTPYAPGQQAQVNFYRDGHRFQTLEAKIRAGAKGVGVFEATVDSTVAGRVRALAVHLATAQLGALQAASEDVTVLASPYLSIGSSGSAVRVLQRSLGVLHYAVPQSGYFDEATADAVVAFRKLTGLPRDYTADSSVFRALRRGEGAFRVRYVREGRHFEANLTDQVLAEIEPGGRVVNIYPISSGKPSTPTVLGNYRVYYKTAGVNAKDMLDANYFTGGYAIHGYPEVPTYAASHGCLRVPDLDAPAIFGWAQLGTPVDVYYAS